MGAGGEGKDLTGKKAAEPPRSEPGADVSRETLRATILALAAERGAGRTICPSEVARHLRGSDETAWRLLMKPIRAEAVRLADEGRLVIRRKGKPVDPHDFKGIYRLSIAGGGSSEGHADGPGSEREGDQPPAS